MLSVYTTLSWRYLRRRWVRALLIVLSIAAGVSMLVATRALNQTMAQAAQVAANPLAGAVDLLVTNGDAPLDRSLAKEVAAIEGVQAARPRIFEKVRVLDAKGSPLDLPNSAALLIGLDFKEETADGGQGSSPWTVEPDGDALKNRFYAKGFLGRPVILGKVLADAIDQAKGKDYENLTLKAARQKEPVDVVRIASVTAQGPAAALGGNLVILDLPAAARVVGLKPGQVTRIDLVLAPGADRDAVRRRVEALLHGRAAVRTPDEQSQSVQNVMASMQVGLLLCGVAALVVGLFLVYNALSVSVAERRHEIGILLAVGATRGQIRRLFGSEAALLGLVGSLLGIPLGVLFAQLALEPMQETVSNIFLPVEARRVEVSWRLLLTALAAGVGTAVLAALVPTIAASREKPAAAVRRIPAAPTWSYRLAQLAGSAALLLLGCGSILVREYLPQRVGLYGGLALVLIAALLATPLLTASLAWLLQPLARRCLGIEGRLAADNIVRAPGRTGVVIAALAAGVALVMQTAGVIRSNRQALRDWVQESIAADLVVTSDSPVSSGNRGQPMDPGLRERLKAIPGVEEALPVQLRKQFYRDTQVLLIALNAADYYHTDTHRPQAVADVELYRVLSAAADGVLISDNFAYLHKVNVGDTITLTSPAVKLRVVGKLVDYSWNHGTIIVNQSFYERHWQNTRGVDIFDVYLVPGTDVAKAQEDILRRLGAENGLVVLSRSELQKHIDTTIERLFGIAYGQQLVVMFVAALGVVTALLISVLQRRREMGLLRAIGALQAQVVRSVLAEAALMGVIGTLIGLAVGVPLQWYALQVIFPEETGFAFPVYIPWGEALLIAAASLATASLAGLGPALHAVRVRIPEAIALE